MERDVTSEAMLEVIAFHISNHPRAISLEINSWLFLADRSVCIATCLCFRKKYGNHPEIRWQFLLRLQEERKKERKKFICHKHNVQYM